MLILYKLCYASGCQFVHHCDIWLPTKLLVFLSFLAEKNVKNVNFKKPSMSFLVSLKIYPVSF